MCVLVSFLFYFACFWRLQNNGLRIVQQEQIIYVLSLLGYVYDVICNNVFAFGSGTGAWESALTNTLSPGDRIVSFVIGQFSLLWVDQQQRLKFNVDVVESEWGRGADLDILESKLASDSAHTIKAICIVHNETATGVTNNLATVRQLLGEHENFLLT